MYTLERLQKDFITICEKANVQCNIPISINYRFRKTLGRVKLKKRNGEWFSYAVEFSSQLLETATDESVFAVIQHEAAHYIVTYRTRQSHGHDKLFKQVCAEIGTSNDKTVFDVQYKKEEKQMFKYQVFCPTCNTIIANRSRMSKKLQHLESCYCNICKQKKLQLIQNW